MKWALDRGFRIASIALTAFNVVGLVTCATTMQQVRLRFAAIYGELLEGGLMLPSATQFVLTVPAWAASAVFLILLVVLLAKELLRPAVLTLMVNVLWFYLGLAGMALFWVVLVAPLYSIFARVM